jgi:hypothetical protein
LKNSFFEQVFLATKKTFTDNGKGLSKTEKDLYRTVKVLLTTLVLPIKPEKYFSRIDDFIVAATPL